MRNKLILYFYLLSIFLLANGSFSNYIFAKLHLSMWRQLIFACGLCIMVRELKNIRFDSLLAYIHKTKVFFIIIVFFSILTIVFEQYNITRILYTWWLYFSGLPFIIFPFVAARCGWSERKTNHYFIYLGLFQTIGLISDFFTNGFFTTAFQQITEDSDELIESGRYCFLAEAPTTFGVYYTLCMTMCFKEFMRVKTLFKKILILTTVTTFIIGAWFSGSRQIVFVLGLVLLLLITYVLMYSHKNIGPTILLGLIIFFFSPTIKDRLYGDKAFEERYSENSIKEDTRYRYWEEGMKFCILDCNMKRILIGEGVGFVHGQKAQPNERIGRHYENSIWTRMSESGIVGIWLYILPIIVLLKNFKRKLFFDYATLVTFVSYLIISYVSPNGEHQTSQMSLYLIFGIFLHERYSQNLQVRI